ncbi:uncharacterized protein LOC109538712 [Dendroctonus ponderosae]|uniref:uncharacterized protein LOC109538712 n=1 Tax=Dendroctonus ponderosae TaxID=77166 RepID=UPI00203599EB|nr:uncharacterized protein LOC109538712 [Dendroctonus ponderosae]KAH1024710.1 hypothetical protein HUJ05_004160 [Dendroctonus ponderosae]
MLRKCTVLALVIVSVLGKNIPVEVRYERLEHDFAGNLGEKVQLSGEQLSENKLRLEKLSVAEEDLSSNVDHSNSIKNLDEKVQLSPEELLQASKHIPIHHSIQDDEDSNDLLRLGELRNGPFRANSLSEPPSKHLLVARMQTIIESGLHNLRSNFMPRDFEVGPSKELWNKFETDVKKYLEEQKGRLDTRQEQNFIQSISSGFQEAANNFLQQFQNQNKPNGTSGDEGIAQQPNPIQGFIGYFTNGVQSIVGTLQNVPQSSSQKPGNVTELGDNGGTQSGIIGSFVNGVQQIFQVPQQGIAQLTGGNTTQADTGNPSGGQQGFFAGAISQINNVVDNFRPTSSQKPPAAQGDEETSQGPNPIQQVFQSFGNLGTAFSQFVQGGPSKPSGSEDETTSQASNPNFIQSLGQNIGSAFQNIQNQFRPPSNQSAASTGSNPIIEQVQSFGNQVQQAAGQVVAGSPLQGILPASTSEVSKNPAEGESSSTPVPPKVGADEETPVEQPAATTEE